MSSRNNSRRMRIVGNKGAAGMGEGIKGNSRALGYVSPNVH